MANLELAQVRTHSGERMVATRVLRQPEVRLQQLVESGAVRFEFSGEGSAELDMASVETAVKYAGYLERQVREIDRARKHEGRRVPDGFPFGSVPGLSREIIHRLTEVRPDTIGQAARIPGMTPAAAAVLACYVARFQPA